MNRPKMQLLSSFLMTILSVGVHRSVADVSQNEISRGDVMQLYNSLSNRVSSDENATKQEKDGIHYPFPVIGNKPISAGAIFEAPLPGVNQTGFFYIKFTEGQLLNDVYDFLNNTGVPTKILYYYDHSTPFTEVHFELKLKELHCVDFSSVGTEPKYYDRQCFPFYIPEIDGGVRQDSEIEQTGNLGFSLFDQVTRGSAGAIYEDEDNQYYFVKFFKGENMSHVYDFLEKLNKSTFIFYSFDETDEQGQEIFNDIAKNQFHCVTSMAEGDEYYYGKCFYNPGHDLHHSNAHHLSRRFTSHSSAACEWNIPIGYKKGFYAPVFFHKTNTTLVNVNYKGQKIRVPNNYAFLVYCPGSTLKGRTVSAVEVKCAGGHKVKVGNPPMKMDLKEIGCSNEISVDVVKMSNSCPLGRNNNAQLYDVGYNVPTSTRTTKFDRVYSVCYDFSNDVPLYSNHMVRGEDLLRKQKQSPKRINFKIPKAITLRGIVNLIPQIIEDVFKKANQFFLFAQKYKSLAYIKKPTDATNFFAKGHLVPNADYGFYGLTWSTFSYLNVAPQYQPNNNGHWKVIEDDVRKLATKFRLNLNIHTGTYGVMEIKNSTVRNKNGMACYLDGSLPNPGNKFPIPKFLWKVVHDQRNNRAAAIVMLNDPLGQPNDINTLLKGRLYCSRQSSWISLDLARLMTNPTLKDKSKGIICLTKVRHLSLAVAHAPKLSQSVQFLL